MKCGNCCKNILVKKQIPNPSYNYNGRFKFNPATSLIVNYQEKHKIEKYLKNSSNLEFKIYPMEAFFMKDFPIGFIYEYQLGIKEKKYCFYYDIENKKCKIYPYRPAVCKYFPLKASQKPNKMPEIATKCHSIKQFVEKEFNINFNEKKFSDSKRGLKSFKI